MVTRPPLFPTSTTTSSLFGTSQTTSNSTASEVDLRQHLDELFFDHNGHRHSQPTVIRHLRRASDGSKIACECKEQFSGEADPDCSYCLGEGWLWDEAWYLCRSQWATSEGGRGHTFKHVMPGQIRSDIKQFFFRYDVPIKYGDKIVEMLLDDEGNVVVPYIREAIYKPQTINRQRSDNGRVEFIAVHCLERNAIRPDVFA